MKSSWETPHRRSTISADLRGPLVRGPRTAQHITAAMPVLGLAARLIVWIPVWPGRSVLGRALVGPRGRVVHARLRVVAGEDAVEVVHILEVVADQRGRVGVGDDVVVEVALVGQDVVDDPAEEHDVAAGPQRDVLVGQGRCAGEPGVDVDDLGTARLRLHDPLEPDRVALGHVGTLDDDAVRVLQVLLECRGTAATERGPQTGDGGTVSNAGLVLYLDRAQRGEQLLDQVVLFIVERGPTE